MSSSPKDHPAAHFEVEDAAQAYQKFEDFTRRILAVPKTEIDRRMAQEKAAKKKRRKHS